MRDFNSKSECEEILTGWKQTDSSPTEQAAETYTESHYDQHAWNSVKLFASIIAHIGFFACLATLIWVALSRDETSNHYVVIPSVFITCCYVIVVLDAALSDVNFALRRLDLSQSADDYLSRVKEARPQVAWYAKCFHYGEQDSSSTCLFRHTRRRKQIVSHEAKDVLKFTTCCDMTLGRAQLLQTPVVMIESTKVFIIKDEQSQVNYMQQYVEFRTACTRHDDCMEHQEVLTIPGFVDHATFLASDQPRPWWLNETSFWVCSLLLMTWPYRWLFNRHSSRIYVVFVKELDVTSTV